MLERYEIQAETLGTAYLALEILQILCESCNQLLYGHYRDLQAQPCYKVTNKKSPQYLLWTLHN